MLSWTGTSLERGAVPWGLLALTAVLTAACGTEDPGASDPDDVAQGPLLPWQPGNTWTYRVTDAQGLVTEKVTVVGDEEPVGGTGPHAAELANRVVTSKRDGADETVSWQRQDGDRVLRYREQSFNGTTGILDLEEHWDPYKLHIDGSAEHLLAGVEWVETYVETKIQAGTTSSATVSDRWIVVSIGTTITVPAGTFEVVVLNKLPAGKQYFYAPGVGKVKELGGQTEELLSFDVAP